LVPNCASWVSSALANPEQLARETTGAIDKLAHQHPDTLAPKNDKRDGRRVTIATYMADTMRGRSKRRVGDTNQAETNEAEVGEGNN